MGTKSKKKAKTRLDAYYRLAKDQGYRSRAAFKLIQLNRKYDFLAKSRSLVDLCAAPGGWCQVAAKFMPIGSKIIGVDLVPIPPIRGVKTFVGDITDDKTRKMIMTYTKKEPVDAVIHDGAPNVGGVWSKDLFAQNALVLSALKTACSLLRPGGWFVSKVFRSTDFQKIIWVLKQFFEKVEATKPLASRMESAEIFVVCAGYKAPKTIDPKLFQAQHVFADVGTERVMLPSGALVIPKSNVPQGYEEFNTIVSRVATMSDFLRCSDPKEFLRTYHEIRFPEEDRKYLSHKGSKKELVYLCMDLQQVSEGDRKKIIRWREALLRAYPIVEAGPQPQGGGSYEEDVDSDDEMVVIPDEDAMHDEAAAAAAAKGAADDADTIAHELLRIRKAHEKELKRKQKKLIDRKLKQVRGLINHNPWDRGDHPTDMGEGFDGEAEAGLGEEWALAAIGRLGEEDMADAFDEMYEEPDGQLNLPLNVPMDVNVDDNLEVEMGGDEFDEDGRGNLLVEGEEDEWDVDNYGNYVPVQRSDRVKVFDGPSDEEEEADPDDDNAAAKKAHLAAKKLERKAKKAAAQRAAVAADSDDAEAEEDDGLSPEERRLKARKEKDEDALDEAGKQAKWQRRHLNIDQVLNRTFPKPKDSKAAKKARNEEERIEMRAPVDASAKAKSRAKGGIEEHPLHDEADLSDSDEGGSDFDDDSDFNDEDDHEFSDDPDVDANRGSMGKVSKLSRDKKRVLLPSAGFLTAQELTKQQRKAVMKDNKEKRRAKREAKKAGQGKKGAKEDTTFEEIPLAMTDPEIRNRTLAMATAMLDKRTRNEMLESGINRFMNNDDDDLPDWFIKDEHRNCVLPTPVTAYDIEQQRLRFVEISSRPSKKVMEAMGRKRKRAQRILRGMIEKGKTDPRVREKTAGLSIRSLIRGKSLNNNEKKKKNQRVDNKVKGELKREKHRLRQAKKGHAKKRR